MEKTDFKEKKYPIVDKTSEFFDASIRICRSKGHQFEKPHHKSSYYDNPRNRLETYCTRCKRWILKA